MINIIYDKFDWLKLNGSEIKTVGREMGTVGMRYSSLMVESGQNREQRRLRYLFFNKS